MSFCPYCGKQLADGVVCNCRNVQTPVATTVQMPVAPIAPVAPVTAASPVTPVTSVLPNEAPETSAESPFVVPMGNNGFYGGMPAGNGAPMGIPAVPVNNSGDSDKEYLEATKDCKIINFLGIVMFLAGVVSVLFINEWVAALIFFVGEFFVLVPKSRVQKLCKTKNPTADRKTRGKIEKEAVKNIKAKNKHFIIASVIAYVCLAGLIVSFIVPVPLIKEEKKDSDGMSYTFEAEATTQNDQSVTDTVGAGESDDSSSGVNDGYAVDVVVGAYSYFLSLSPTDGTPMAPTYPYATYVNFEADGTGDICIRTGSSGEISHYCVTWEYYGIENDMRKYTLYLGSNENMYVYYGDNDMCVMYTSSAVNGYMRVSGNAQDNLSGTQSSAFDITGKSFDYAYAFDSVNTQMVSPELPYVGSMAFGSGNVFTASMKMSYGVETFTGTWSYEQLVDETYFYIVDFEEGWSLHIMYNTEMGICMLMDNSEILYCYEYSNYYSQ